MLGHLAVLAAGVVAAAVGGELFVRGAVGLAARFRVPAGIIGATIAAFATSTPELSVGIQSASAGRPELALGDALGSNVFNIAVVLGLVVMLGPLRASRLELRRDLRVAMLAPLITLVAVIDGRLVRAEAAVLLAVFAGWLVAVGREAIDERSASGDVLAERGASRIALAAVGGIVMLVIAGRVVVPAAKGVGDDLGLDPFVVGATMVALGTSTPEIATAVISRRRGHSEVGVGTALGSNVFNNLWIVGVVAMINPVETNVSEVLLSVVACLAALGLIVPTPEGVVVRWRGAALGALAVLYIVGTVALGAGP